MEKTSLPKNSQLSSIYIPDRRHFDADSVALTGLQEETSPLIRLLQPSLLPLKEVGTLEHAEYNYNTLRLLDDLQCPVLLLPRIKNETTVQRIGFLSDVLFTGKGTLSILTKIAKSLHASITLFNIAESALPEMDPAYARRHFIKNGLAEVDGVKINMVNLRKKSTNETIEAVFDQHQITMAAATRQRKELLYRLVS